METGPGTATHVLVEVDQRILAIPNPTYMLERKVSNLVVGELVLIQDDDLKRGKWPLGRIVNVMPSTDGVVRVAEVRTANGTYTRPAAKLYKLEDNGNELMN